MLDDVNFLENSNLKYEYLNRIEDQDFLTIENDNMISMDSKNIEEKALRIIKNDKVSLSYGSGAISMEKIVENCSNLLNFSETIKDDFEYEPSCIHSNAYERKNAIYSIDTLFTSGKLISNSIYSMFRKRFKITVYCWFSNTELFIRNYKSLNKHFKDQTSYFFVRATEHQTNNSYGLVIYNNKNLELINEFIRFLDLTSVKSNIYTTNKCKVILHPRIMRNIVLPIWKDINRLNLETNLSIVSNFRNISSKVSLYVGSNDKRLNSFSPFDHEGIHTEQVAIINDGNLSTSITDKKYVSRVGSKFKKDHFTYKFKISMQPSLFPNSFKIGQGSIHSNELIRSTKEGILIVDSPNLWQNTDNRGNMKGTIGLGFKIFNGRLVGSLRGLNFSLNTYDILGKNLVEISNDRQIVCDSSDIMPYILTNGVDILY